MTSLPTRPGPVHEPDRDLDARLDLRALLDAAEAAPPAEGVDALAAELAERAAAAEVSLLIADISGLALVTDGMSEREAAEAQIEKLLGTLRDLHPREAVQILTGAVLHVTGGAMRDDARVLIIDWYGDTRPMRTPATTGAWSATRTTTRAGG